MQQCQDTLKEDLETIGIDWTDERTTTASNVPSGGIWLTNV